MQCRMTPSLSFCVFSLFCSLAAEASSVRDSASASSVLGSKHWTIQVPKTSNPRMEMHSNGAHSSILQSVSSHVSIACRSTYQRIAAIQFQSLQHQTSLPSSAVTGLVMSQARYQRPMHPSCSVPDTLCNSAKSFFCVFKKFPSQKSHKASAMQGAQATTSGRGTASQSLSRPGQALLSWAAPRIWCS